MYNCAYTSYIYSAFSAIILLVSWYFLPALLYLNEVEVDTKGGEQVVNLPLLAGGVL
jgi:hypothetical protein